MDKEKIREVELMVTESRQKVGVMHTLFNALKTEDPIADDIHGMFYGLTLMCDEIAEQLGEVTDIMISHIYRSTEAPKKAGKGVPDG